jgi:hypothetical protein
VLESTIWARLDVKRGELTIEAGLPKNTSIGDEFEMARFRAHALAAAQSHPEWDKLEAKAEAVLTGTNVKPTFDKPTRLVRRIGGQTETVATVATPATT